MIAALLAMALAVVAQAPAKGEPGRASVILVVGAPGSEEYGKQFSQWAGQWKAAAEKGGAALRVIGLDESGTTDDRTQLQQAIEAEPRQSHAELWLVLIGHGTYDGKTAKFNLRGPDVAHSDLSAWCKEFQRPLALINSASSSGPFLPELSGPGRVIVTATKSGVEQNFSRFGGFIAQAIGDDQADLDKDGQTSLLEAFLIAARRTDQFYASEDRLATEHALLDDNGDRLGTRADWYTGLRAVKKPKPDAQPDGYRAHQFHLVRSTLEQSFTDAQRSERNELELAVAALRQRKAQMEETAYYAELEKLLRRLAVFYESTRGR
jgi:hypothetical protein